MAISCYLLRSGSFWVWQVCKETRRTRKPSLR